MDIEKLKAEFEQSECFKRLEHVAQYTFFEFGAYIKRTDVPADIEKKCGKLITALLFSWSAWKEAKAQAMPEGFVLVKKELPEQIAEKMAIDRIDKPRHENDPVWSEIAEQSYKDQVKSKKWEFWRDYKAMIEAQEPAND
ncbi:hypothetical protein KTJ53_01045 [Acinetobacter variabilis]|uniref:hypothetical protein n=1 Tax=Acinetobacter TaxID=469 RepID=UPI0021D3367A|nr:MULTISPECIES: hypothetical protein [Acinetobacter]MCU4628303.1 hypothetical protein [Acinetobacter variabilis]